LEADLKGTKQTLGTAALTLVKKVRKLEDQLKTKKRKGVVFDFDEEKNAAKENIDFDGLYLLAKASLASASVDDVDFDMDAHVQHGADQEPDEIQLSYFRRRHIQRVRRNFTVGSTGVTSTSAAETTIPTTKDDLSNDHTSTKVPSDGITTDSIPADVPSDGVSAHTSGPTVTTVELTIPTTPIGVSFVSMDKGKSIMMEEDSPVNQRIKR
jgi:hypothetical protein